MFISCHQFDASAPLKRDKGAYHGFARTVKMTSFTPVIVTSVFLFEWKRGFTCFWLGQLDSPFIAVPSPLDPPPPARPPTTHPPVAMNTVSP